MKPDVGGLRTMSGDEWAVYHADQRRTSDATPMTGDDPDAMTTPTPLLREALATALHESECPSHAGSVVRHTAELGVGYHPCRQRADHLLAHPFMQAVAEHERTDSALDLQTERDLAEAYYPTLERHLREHGCDHDFAEVANADGVLGGDSKDLNAERAEHVAVGRAVARLLEATKDEAGLALLHVPAGTRPDGRVIATEEGWTVERWASVWGHVTSNGATLPEAIVAALGPSEGERT